MSQIQNIRQLIDEITKINGLSSPEVWKNNDYQVLKSLIQTKTGQIISERTIKRIIDTVYRGTNNNIPKSSTLHLFAETAGYKDWFDYTLKQGYTKKGKQLKKRNTKHFIIIVIAIITIVLFFVTVMIERNIQEQKSNKLKAEISFHVESNILFIPDVLTFDYNVPNKLDDSVFIHIEGDHAVYEEMMSSIRYLNPGKNKFTYRFQEPGKYFLKILSGNEVIQSYAVYGLNKKWQYVIYNSDDNSLEYQPIVNDSGFVNIGESDFAALQSSKTKRNKVKFVFMDTLGFSLDNCTIETRIRNNYFDGVGCNLFKMIVYGSENDIRLFLGDEKCYDQTKIGVSEVFFEDKDHNLKNLHRNFSAWTDIKMQLKENKFNLYFNNEEVYSTAYGNAIGTVNGFVFWFLEGGGIDYVRCYNENDSLIYQEEFNE